MEGESPAGPSCLDTGDHPVPGAQPEVWSPSTSTMGWRISSQLLWVWSCEEIAPVVAPAFPIGSRLAGSGLRDPSLLLRPSAPLQPQFARRGLESWRRRFWETVVRPRRRLRPRWTVNSFTAS